MSEVLIFVAGMIAPAFVSAVLTLFNLDFTEIAEEAWERAGREMRSGYDLRTARRSMNLMTIEWQNRGINMWTMEQGFINLTPGLATYALPTDTIDLLEQVIRTGQNSSSTQADLTITRISVSTYATIPNKLQQARPIQVWVQRLSGQVNPTDAILVGAISSTDTTLTLNTVVGLAGSGFIRLNSEDIYYTYISGNTLGGVFRGQNNTTAASQADGTAVFVPQLPAVTGVHSSPCITPFAVTVAIGVIDALAPATIPPRQ